MTSKKSLKELITLNTIDNTITEKQINIIIAAIELFSEKGYEATATSEIAKKANVAEGTIFRHYKTKKDLLLAIPDILSKISLHEIFADDLDKLLNSEYETFEEFLTELILNRKAFVSETSPLLKILFQEAPFHPQLRNKFFNILLRPSLEKITAIINKFKNKDKIIDMPSDIIVNLIFSSVFGYLFVNYISLPELKSDEEDINYLIQFIVNAVCKNNNIEN